MLARCWRKIRKLQISVTWMVVTLVGTGLILGPSLVDAAKDKETDYEKLTFEKARALYHLKTNELFNKRTELLLSGKGSVKGDCDDEKDVTTYCLAGILTDEYFKYRAALLKKKDNPLEIDRKNPDLLFKRYLKNGDPGLTSALFGKHDKNFRDQFVIATQHIALVDEINAELNAAQKSLDNTLAAYHELRMAFPLHEKLKTTLKNLEEYKRELKRARGYIETFPGKFHNATTTKCQ